MDELIVSKEEIEKWTEKLKKLLDVNSENFNNNLLTRFKE